MKTPLTTRTFLKGRPATATVAAAFLALLLNACGGGAAGHAVPGNGSGSPSTDTGTPRVTGVQIGAPSDGRVTLTAVATDDVGVTGYCFRSDATVPASGDACFSASAAATADVPATHATWRVYARDAAGHVSAAFEQLLDLQAPVVTAMAPVGLASGRVSVKISASDSHGVSAVCLRADAVVPLASDACFTAGDTVGVAAVIGSASYRAYARDASGNVSTAFESSVDAYAALDTGLPAVTGVAAARQADGRYALTATTRDDQGVSGVCFRTDATAPAATDDCFKTTSAVVDAPATFQTFKVYARDNAGHVSAAYEHTLDVVAPVVSAVSLTEVLGTQVKLRIDASDTHGLSAVCLRLASEAAPAASDACVIAGSAVTVSRPIDFRRYLAYARDIAGNVSAPFAYTLDMVTPSVVSVKLGVPVDGVVPVTAKAVDSVGVTGFCLRSDETVPTAADPCFSAVTPSQTANTTLSLPLPAAQTTMKVYARDATGHVSVAARRTLAACSDAGKTASAASSLPTVCFLTTLGEFVIELENVKAPISSRNILAYVDEDFYGDTQFHRIMSNFMVQGGGYTAAGVYKTPTRTAIALEKTSTTGLSNIVGTVAMARSTAANSGTSQFFINVVDNTSTLNGSSTADGYAVFGRVISGMASTVQAIRNVNVKDNGAGENSKPLDPPKILWAYRLK